MNIAKTLLTLTVLIALATSIATAQGDSSNPKEGHWVGIGASTGFPQLISGELRIVSVSHLEFGVGLGGFPANALAQSLYSFAPLPIDLQTGDTYNIYPSGTYTLSGVYAFARWFPWCRGWFLNLSLHSLSLSATIGGMIKDETLNTSVNGALAATVMINQLMINLGPGYQFFLGEHFHLDAGLGLTFLLPPSSSVAMGGSLASFVVLNSAATASYNEVKSNLVGAVNQAMTSYANSLRFLPSVYLTIGYIF